MESNLLQFEAVLKKHGFVKSASVAYNYWVRLPKRDMLVELQHYDKWRVLVDSHEIARGTTSRDLAQELENQENAKLL